MLTWDRIFAAENKLLALNHVMRKPYSSGPDHMQAAELGDFLSINEKTIEKRLRNGQYEPGLTEIRELLNYKGKSREIGLCNCLDRYIQRCIAQQLEEELEPLFSEQSYAYRETRGTQMAVEKICDYIQQGYRYVVKLDIKSYFDTVDLQLLSKMLAQYLAEDSLKTVIDKYLYCTVRKCYQTYKKSIGLVQGSSLSPVLSNCYLMPLDSYIEKSGWAFVRFADDIKLFAKTPVEAKEMSQRVKNYLRDRLMLDINEEKSATEPVCDSVYFGYKIRVVDGMPEAYKKQRDNKTIYAHWHNEAIAVIDGHYQIIQDGILTAKDYALVFENENVRVNLPVANMDALNLQGDISLTPRLLSFAANNKLSLNFYDGHNRFIGRFAPESSYRPASMTLKQAEIYLSEEKRIQYAYAIEAASIRSVLFNLNYYERRGNNQKEIASAIGKIKNLLKKMKQSKKVEELLLFEAQCREIYFACFDFILQSPDFTFTKRTRRPPKDAINSLIGYCNAIVYRRVADEIHKTNLDIRISFAHSAKRRVENLNLDLAELFKPIIADHVIFRLVNCKMIDAKKDFITLGGNGIWLGVDGKKTVMYALKKRLYQKLRVNGSEITYEALIRQEIRKLQRSIETGSTYQPYFSA